MDENQKGAGPDPNPQGPGSVQPATELPVQQTTPNTSQSPTEPIQSPIEPQLQSTPPQPPKSSNKILITGLIFLIIAAMVGGGYLYFQNQKQKFPTSQVSPTPISQQPTPTPDTTADWETYIDETYNYSVKYPAGWTLSQKCLGGSPTDNYPCFNSPNYETEPEGVLVGDSAKTTSAAII